MIKNIYDVTLKLITPSKTGDRIDFTKKEKDILEAVYYFNDKFRMWDKRIIIHMVSKKSIHLLLIMEKEKAPDHVTAREIRFFTMYLNKEKEWNQYSRNTSKLFEGANFEEVDLEVAQQLINEIDEASALFDVQHEEIEFLKNYNPRMMGEPAENSEGYISDEDVIAVVTYLVRTKNKGRRSDEKQETLGKIKNMLEKWM